MARLGGNADKRTADKYVLPTPNQLDIDAAYRTSWLARKVIDIPAQDMLREWRFWQAENDQIELIEAEEKRLKLHKCMEQALRWARLYGGAAIIMGINQGTQSTPVNVETLKQGSLEFCHAVTRYELTVAEMDKDPLSPGYRTPKSYRINGGVAGGSVEIHPSRVIRFIGNEIPDAASMGGDGWGDPVWYTIRDAVKNCDMTAAGMASLVHEAKVDVISVPGLMENLGTAEYESRLLKRFGLAMVQKSINSVLLLDGGAGDGKSGEVWSRKEMTFSGLPDVMKLFLAMAAGAADIPATRLLGKAPDGMNATGDGDLSNYHDMLASRQEMELRPALEQFDDVMIRSVLGKRPDEIYWSFAPLSQSSPTELAALEKVRADTVQVYANMGIIPDSALATVAQNRMVESEQWPGLEAALDEAEAANELPPMMEEPTPEEIAAAAGQGAMPGKPKLVASNDAEKAEETSRFVWTESEFLKMLKRAGLTLDYNENHDPHTGEFSEGGGSGSGSGGGESSGETKQSRAFTEHQEVILQGYKEGDYKEINRYLDDPSKVSPLAESEYKSRVRTLDAAINKSSLVDDTVVYRGIQSKYMSENAEKFVGRTVNAPTYLSTTTKLSVAQDFAGFSDKAVILRIKAPKGMKSVAMAKFETTNNAGEKELLFGRGHNVKITGVQRLKRHVIVSGEFVQVP